jgi:hypothetical protein
VPAASRNPRRAKPGLAGMRALPGPSAIQRSASTAPRTGRRPSDSSRPGGTAARTADGWRAIRAASQPA